MKYIYSNHFFSSTHPGTSLLVSLGLITLITLVSIGVTTVVVSSIRDSANVNRANEAFYAAEGALEQGLLANMGAGAGFSSSATNVSYNLNCGANIPGSPGQDNQNPGGTEPCIVKAQYVIQGQVPKGKTFITGNYPGLYSIPTVGTGTVGQNCDPLNPVLTDFQYPGTDPNDPSYFPEEHPCNWNKLAKSESVSIPLYYTDSNNDPVNLFQASSVLKIRIRAACSNGQIFCATRPDLDYAIGDVNYGFDDPIVSWNITGEDADNGNSYTLLPYINYDSIITNTWKAASSIINEKKINAVKLNGNPVFTESSQGVDASLNCRGLIKDFLTPNTDASVPCVPSHNWSLQNLIKPILKISVITDIQEYQGGDLPYLEYQILSDSLTSEPADTVQTVTAEGFSGAFKQVLEVKIPQGSGLLEYVIQQ